MLYNLCCYVELIIHPFDLFSVALNYFRLCGFSFHASCGPLDPHSDQFLQQLKKFIETLYTTPTAFTH